MTKEEYQKLRNSLHPQFECDMIHALDREYIAGLEKHLENSVSKFELDTCRQLNEALRQREDKMRKAMRNAGFVWSDDEFREIEK